KFSPPRTNGSTDRMPHAKTPLEVDFARHTFFGILKYELDGRDPQRDRRRQSRVPTRRHASEALAYCATHRGKGLERVGEPHLKHVEGRFWETRLKGRSGISRALYVTAAGRRVVIVRVFVKKTERVPRREIELALSRAKSVQ